MGHYSERLKSKVIQLVLAHQPIKTDQEETAKTS